MRYGWLGDSAMLKRGVVWPCWVYVGPIVFGLFTNIKRDTRNYVVLPRD
jgi:hypothetical protein